jgi:hypothetical protein
MSESAAPSKQELATLKNLARKKAGEEVGWINIADARALTELGLAQRNRAGWEITAEGSALVEGKPAASGSGDAGGNVVAWPPHTLQDKP